jgi:GxxExxY protein
MQEGNWIESQREWELTGQVLSAAIAVHRALGPGFVESIYEHALVVELTCREIGHARQVHVPVFYRGVEIGFHRLDLIVDGRVVVELKAVRQLLFEHISVVRSYIRASGCTVGLLLNFATPRLEAKRIYHHEPSGP